MNSPQPSNGASATSRIDATATYRDRQPATCPPKRPGEGGTGNRDIPTSPHPHISLHQVPGTPIVVTLRALPEWPEGMPEFSRGCMLKLGEIVGVVECTRPRRVIARHPGGGQTQFGAGHIRAYHPALEVAKRAKGDYREAVLEEFQYLANHPKPATAEEARTVIEWLSASEIPDKRDSARSGLEAK